MGFFDRFKSKPIDLNEQFPVHPDDLDLIKGNAESQFKLGLMYIRGEGKSKDYENGIKYCLKAAKQGHVKAQYVLGSVYSNTFQNYKEAINWYSKAAAQGNAEAQAKLDFLTL